MHFTSRLLLAICLILPCGGNHEHNSVGWEKHHHHGHRHHKTGSKLDPHPAWQEEEEEEGRQGRIPHQPKPPIPPDTQNTGEIRGVYFVVKLDESPPPTKTGQSSTQEGDYNGGGGKRWKRSPGGEVSDVGSTGQPPVITTLNIKANVVNRFSTTRMTSIISNPDSVDREANFVVQIPEKAFISNFTMYIDEEFFIAEVKEKAEAEKEYEEAKKRNETAGKVSRKIVQPARGMEVFSVAVNVAANSKVEFTLTYQQLLERKLGLYTQVISVRPNQVVQDFSVQVVIEESQGITFLNVSLNDKALDDKSYQMLGDASTREITYTPSTDSQTEMDPVKGLNADLKVMYDVTHLERDAGLVCVDGDYFIHYFSPSGLDPLNKHIVFAIDVSGSMSGAKIKQTVVAMWSILDVLRPRDNFQLILFDDKLRYWPMQRKLVAATPEYVRAAKQFVRDELKAQGSTNINDALLEACRTLKNQGQWGSNIIVFLTDGQPTAGETQPDKIVNNVVEEAANKISIFSLGFGSKHDLDFDLLKKISYRTGVAEGAVRIYPGLEADDQLRSFFQLVNTPLMFDVRISYPIDIVIVDSITQRDFPQYFDGSELVVAGKLHPNSVITNKAMSVSVGGVTTMEVKFEKTVDLSASCPKVSRGYIQKLYAYMMIKYLLIQEQKTDFESTQEQIRADALRLALDYNLVTPLTSMVITQQARDRNNLQYDDFQNVKLHASMSGRAVSNVATTKSKIFFLALFISAIVTTL